MAKPALSKESLLPALAAHVLAHGMGAASLRRLAGAAGTSDRMLIYHFGNKERLIAELLAYLAEGFAGLLDSAFGGEPAASRADCLARVLGPTYTPAMQPYMALWWDMVAGAARDEPAYRTAAQAVMERLLAWLEQHMPPDDPDPAGGARFLLTLIEGAQMLEAVGRGDIARRGLGAVG